MDEPIHEITLTLKHYGADSLSRTYVLPESVVRESPDFSMLLDDLYAALIIGRKILK